jgi:hypothetical protein
MHRKEYDRLRAKIEADYQRDLDALERIWAIAGVASPQSKSDSTQPKGEVMRVIREAVLSISGDVTVQVVEQHIAAAFPDLASRLKRPSVSSALQRLAADEELEIKELGRGKRPTVYVRRRKIQSLANPATEGQIAHIRNNARLANLSAAKFRELFLDRYGVEKLRELNANEASEVLAETEKYACNEWVDAIICTSPDAVPNSQ